MKETKLKSAKTRIITTFNETKKRIFTSREIFDILRNNRTTWMLAQSTTSSQFLKYLEDELNIIKIELNFPYRKEVRYIWGEQSIYEVLLSLYPNSYFTHYTAMFFNELTEQIPKVIYINHEQNRKSILNGELEQVNITRAFQNATRISRNVTEYNGVKIHMLNGMNTEETGVIDFRGLNGENIRITDIERTLIDITVRPIYSGGIYEVLKAFRLAHGKVSINKLVSYLKKINYIYPYHQAIGFYLETTGMYKDSSIELLKKIPIKYDFYLTNQMKETEYSKEWRLFYPKGFNNLHLSTT